MSEQNIIILAVAILGVLHGPAGAQLLKWLTSKRSKK